jgi:hypothetical protein
MHFQIEVAKVRSRRGVAIALLATTRNGTCELTHRTSAPGAPGAPPVDIECGVVDPRQLPTLGAEFLRTHATGDFAAVDPDPVSRWVPSRAVVATGTVH